MATNTYTVINGEILHENRAGVQHDYVSDPLGSTAALLSSTQTQTDSWSYWPYGEVRTRTGSTSTPFQFVGTLGYYRDSSSRTYVRARVLKLDTAAWLNTDPLGQSAARLNLYAYVRENPTTNVDPSGLQGPVPYPDPHGQLPSYCPPPSHCARCTEAIYDAWWDTDAHYCNHPYTHCMLCCILASQNGADCARDVQTWQNRNPLYWSRPGMQQHRMDYCEAGIFFAEHVGKGKTCDSLCRHMYKWREPPVDRRCTPQQNRNRQPLPIPKACTG